MVGTPRSVFRPSSVFSVSPILGRMCELAFTAEKKKQTYSDGVNSSEASTIREALDSTQSHQGPSPQTFQNVELDQPSTSESGNPRDDHRSLRISIGDWPVIMRSLEATEGLGQVSTPSEAPSEAPDTTALHSQLEYLRASIHHDLQTSQNFDTVGDSSFASSSPSSSAGTVRRHILDARTASTVRSSWYSFSDPESCCSDEVQQEPEGHANRVFSITGTSHPSPKFQKHFS